MIQTKFLLGPLKVLLYLLILLLIFEGWHRSSVTEVFVWLLEKPLNVLVNLAILFSLYLLFKALIGRPRIAVWLVSVLGLIFHTVSRQKLTMKGEPLFPWDFNLGNEAADIKEYFEIFSSNTEILVLCLLALFCILVPFVFTNHKQALKTRSILFVIPITLVVFFFLEEVGSSDHWHQSISYQINGVQQGFILAMKEMNPKPPENYSLQKLQELIDKYELGEESTELQPNIIFVMNEAFWDPTRLENLTFSEDPLPFFRELQKSETAGELLVPVLGGSTANTEFEILTGNSMNFLPQGSLAYSQYVKKQQPALASILRDHGYQTVAIHTYLDWFYQRKYVYEYFGFDDFISSKDFKEPKLRRGFIADNEMTDKIINVHQQSDAPLFVFAVTMQNHSPFNMNHYDEDRIEVSGPLSDEHIQKVNTYSTGVRDADDSLKNLVEHFKTIDEPTVIIFFGDHLPLLGDVYSEISFISDQNPTHWSKEEYLKMYSVPFIVWDNFSDKKEQDLMMNASFLGAYILDQYGLPKSPYMNFLNEVRRENQPVFSVNKAASRLSKSYQDLYQLFQYHYLFGK